MTAWLDIIGIGEDGVDGLRPPARMRLEQAEIIIGGDRHHALAPNITAERLNWPSPFDAMIDVIMSHRGKKLVILVTGDPLWYSVGARISRAIDPAHIRFHPQLSAFQLAAARMGWSLADCETLTVHGRADSQIVPHIAPGVRLLVLTQNADSPKALSQILCEEGYGQSRMTVLAAMDGPSEARFDGTAHDWAHTVPDFHTLAIECVAGPTAHLLSTVGGLADDSFINDGQLTKRDVRAATLSKLAPYPDAVLWDIGAGCGSISVEWMRASRGAMACAIERDAGRLDMIRQNARSLGTEKITLVEGSAPEGLAELPQADAIFVGGGLTDEGVFDAAWAGLREGGRLVANAVTLESEAALIELHRIHGGELTRITVQHAAPIGDFRGWKPAMPVTQWLVTKPWKDMA